MADPAARLRALADALPDDGGVTLTRRAILELLGESGDVVNPSTRPTAPGDDPSLAEIAKRFNRPVRRVRQWIREGRLQGAYKLGRCWKVPESSIAEMIAHEQRRAAAKRAGQPTTASKPAKAGDWRKRFEDREKAA